jgi:hypothetical protein
MLLSELTASGAQWPLLPKYSYRHPGYILYEDSTGQIHNKRGMSFKIPGFGGYIRCGGHG